MGTVYPAALIDRLGAALAEATKCVEAMKRYDAGEPWESESVEVEVDLGAELNAAVRVVAEQLGVTPNEIIVRAVREYLDRRQAEEVPA